MESTPIGVLSFYFIFGDEDIASISNQCDWSVDLIGGKLWK